MFIVLRLVNVLFVFINIVVILIFNELSFLVVSIIVICWFGGSGFFVEVDCKVYLLVKSLLLLLFLVINLRVLEVGLLICYSMLLVWVIMVIGEKGWVVVRFVICMVNWWFFVIFFIWLVILFILFVILIVFLLELL